MRPARSARIAFASALVGVAFYGTTVHASGFDAPNVGSQQSGPVTRDAAAVYHNPAQLGYLDHAELSLGAGVIFGSLAYQRDRRGTYQSEDTLWFSEATLPPEDRDPNKTGRAERVRAAPVGPAVDLFFAIPAIRERLSFGVGVYVPYAAILDLPRGGAQRFQAQSLSLISAHATLAAGVKLHEVVSLGAGVSYVLSTMSLHKVQDFGAVDAFGDGLAADPIAQENDFGVDAPTTVRELAVLARPIQIERMLAHGVSFHAGVALRPTKKLDLALVYHHGARVRLNGDFTLDMNDDFFTQDLAAQGLQYPPLVEGDARVEFRLPKRITLGAGYLIHKKFSLDGFVSYVFYQDFDRIGITLSSPDLAQPTLGIADRVSQDLVRNWKGTVHTEVFGRIRPIEKLVVSVLAGYHSPASPDSTVDMASPDGHRLIFGAGVGWTFNDRFTLFGDFEGQAIVPRTVTASVFDLGNGRYDLFLGQFTIHGQIHFGLKARKRRASPAPAEPTAADPPDAARESTPTPTPAPEPAPSPQSVPPPPPPPPPPDDAA